MAHYEPRVANTSREFTEWLCDEKAIIILKGEAYDSTIDRVAKLEAKKELREENASRNLLLGAGFTAFLAIFTGGLSVVWAALSLLGAKTLLTGLIDDFLPESVKAKRALEKYSFLSVDVEKKEIVLAHKKFKTGVDTY